MIGCGTAQGSGRPGRTTSAVRIPASRAASSSSVTSDRKSHSAGARPGRGDPTVARSFPLRAHGGVEEGGQVGGEVARGRMGEEQPLRKNTARGEDAGLAAILLPAPQGGRHVGVDRSHQGPRPKARFPDPALERLQGGGLPVAVHEPEDIGGGGGEVVVLAPGRGWVGRALPPVLGPQGLDLGTDPGVRGVLPQECGEAPPREREQGAGDELDRGGRPLDVEEEAGHPEAAPRPATWAGPRQTGSNPRSTPLSV